LISGPKNAWIAKLYAEQAPYPNGNTMAQSIFQSGVIPGETDFQVYRDFGGKHIENIDFVPGLDLVAVTNGQVYHTDLDTAELISPGSMQV